ncbi:AraC-like ligand-binding domain-containing protein [Streptomyces zhihengii]
MAERGRQPAPISSRPPDMETIYDSTDVPRDIRTDVWQETLRRSLVGTQTTFPGEQLFRARIGTTALGPAQFSSMTYTGCVSRRTQALIRQSDPELYQVAVVRSGQQGMEQERRLAVVDYGDMVLYSSSRPFEATVASDGNLSTSLVLQFPRKLLPLPERQVTGLLAVPLAGRTGMGRLLTQFLSGLDENTDACSPRDKVRLGCTALDLVAAVVAHHLERRHTMPPESRHYVLFLRMSAFVDENLRAPELDPATLASAHHLSLRTLQRIFSHHGTTAAAFIRKQRLEQSRKELGDPRLGRLSIGSVAARCGFLRQSDFTRAFRNAYGMSPGEYRRHGRPGAPDMRLEGGGTQSEGNGTQRQVPGRAGD